MSSPLFHSIVSTTFGRITFIFLAFLLALCAIYLPTLIHTFGHSDDYVFFALFRSGLMAPLVNPITAMGRPLNSLILWAFLGHGNDMHTLTWLRAFGLATQAGFAASIYVYLRKFAYSKEISFAVAALWIFTPTMAVWAGWAIVTHYALGMTLAFWGGVLLLQIMTTDNPRWISLKSLIAATLMLSAVAMYQSTFYAACLPWLLWYFRRVVFEEDLDLRPLVIKLIQFMVYTSAVLIAYMIVFKTYSQFVEYDDPAVTRTRLSLTRILELPSDLSTILLMSLKGWTYFYHPTTQWLMVSAQTSIVALLWITKGWRITLQTVLVFFIFFCWSLMPFYVSENSGVPFRVMSMQYIFALLPITGVLLYSHTQKFTRIGAVSLAVIAGCFSGWLGYHGIVKPNLIEVNRYRAVLLEKFDEFPEKILFRFSFGMEQNVMHVIGEFGMHSMWLDWVPQHLIHILLNEQFDRPTVPRNLEEFLALTVIRVYPWQEVNLNAFPLLDDYEIRFGRRAAPPSAYDRDFWSQFGRSTIYMEEFGEVELLSDGWIYTPELGFKLLR